MLSELELLQEKIGKLLKQYTALQAENTRLQQLRQEGDNLVRRHQEEITALQERLRAQALTETDISAADIQRADLKQYLTQVIGEIERSLAALK